MPRDTDKRAYITVSINKDSELMRQLVEDERRKGIPKSHLIVSYADEYVRLFIQGNMVPVATQNTGQSVAITPTLNPQNDPIITSNLSDGDLADAYGD